MARRARAPRCLLRYFAAALLVGTTTPAAAACPGEPLGTAEVAEAVDNRTLQLRDGREVRLAGLAAWPGNAGGLRQLTAGRRIGLRGDDAPDRYGRQTAFATLDDTGELLQTRLLDAGLAVASGRIPDPDCAAELAAAEAAARAAGRGVWSDRAAIKNAQRPHDVLAKLGHFAIVEGKVGTVRTAGATVYVNFGPRWSRDFAVTIPARAVPAFVAAGRAPESLAGRRVRVRGIVARRGGPRIEASHAAQIELVDVSERQERR